MDLSEGRAGVRGRSPWGLPRAQHALFLLATKQIIWRSDRLTAKASPDHVSVIDILPTSTLTPGRYALDLTGGRADGKDELIGSYPFRVPGS